MAKPKVAIATLLIGASYQQMWRRYCEISWRKYANHYDFDLLIGDAALAPSGANHTLTWQKLLIGRLPDVSRYDYVVWIDGDIVITMQETPPNILDGMDPEKIGAVRDHALLSYPMYEGKHRALCGGLSWPEFAQAVFAEAGIDAPWDCLLNSGVLVVPKAKLGFLEDVYTKYNDRPVHPQQGEQPFLSYELHKNNLLHLLDERFNAIWYEFLMASYWTDAPSFVLHAAVQKVLSTVYFLHFTGDKGDMRHLEQPTPK